MNTTVRRIFGAIIAIGSFVYALSIVTQVMSGALQTDMLIFAIFLAIIGLMGVGFAFNFNNILNNQPKSKMPAKPAGPMTKAAGIALLLLGALNFSKIITPHASLLDLAGDLVLPIILIGIGIGALTRK